MQDSFENQNNNIRQVQSLPAKVLISQFQFINLFGSEIVTLEVVEYFLKKGCQVLIWTPSFGGRIEAEMAKFFEIYPDSVSVTSDKNIANDFLKNSDDDSNLIAWIHHNLIPEALFDSEIRKKATIIFNHMSSYHPVEFPLNAGVEEALADVILFNSRETKTALVKILGNTSRDEKYFLFENPAPDEFIQHELKIQDVQNSNQNQYKFLVVSNHIPAEILSARDILINNGVCFDVVGLGHNVTRINSEILSKYDAIISIGKTVQYSLVLGVSVYVYDHFGGPGWLDDENFDLASHNNFSGRGFSKKNGELIVEELISSIDEAKKFVSSNKEKFIKKYSLDIQISEVLRLAKKNHYESINRKSKVVYKNFVEAEILTQTKISEAMIMLSDSMHHRAEASRMFETSKQNVLSLQNDVLVLQDEGVALKNKVNAQLATINELKSTIGAQLVSINDQSKHILENQQTINTHLALIDLHSKSIVKNEQIIENQLAELENKNSFIESLEKTNKILLETINESVFKKIVSKVKRVFTFSR